MAFHIFIPARFASERFPGKPLIDLAGKPMIQRVCEQALRSAAASVQVATDDERIVAAVESFGGEAILTSSSHQSGTDRIQEAASKAGLGAADVIVNVQGDEPAIPPAAIDQVAALVQGDVRMASLCEPITDAKEVFNPNIVKVVRDRRGPALYFSRAPVPYDRSNFPDGAANLAQGWFRHLGIYAYTRQLLDDFVSWPASPLEQLEHLEQLRALEQGVAIHVAEAGMEIPPGIDAPEDVSGILKYIAD
ncbi:MAG: 3-deoxy-manno-octulosonate cytidylyltransferase [Pseudomonadales bacterium]